MHPGNLFVDAQDRLVIVDCGIMGRLGLKERRFLAETSSTAITRNWRRTARKYISRPTCRSITRSMISPWPSAPSASRSSHRGQISMARLLALLLEVTALFDMQTRPELLLLQKTLVVVEGVARSLDPQLDMWKTARPVVEDWIAGNLGPVGQLQRAGGGLVNGPFRRHLTGAHPGG